MFSVRCPGETCSRWRNTTGDTYEEKTLACIGCDKCDGKPPIPTNSNKRVFRCPGGEGNCDLWDAAGGDFDIRSKICLDCPECKGNPPSSEINEKPIKDEVGEIVEEVVSIIERQNAGFITNWKCYGFEYQILVTEWRKAENQIKVVREINFQNFMKAFTSEN